MVERYVDKKIRVLNAICQNLTKANSFSIESYAVKVSPDSLPKIVEELGLKIEWIDEIPLSMFDGDPEHDDTPTEEISIRYSDVDGDKILNLLKNLQGEYPKRETPLINEKALEIMAIEIGEFETGAELVNLLKKWGVDEELIIYPKTKWRMVNDVFQYLTYSDRGADHKTLFRIIEESVYPLMHKGDEKLANEIQDKFNRLLKYDGFSLKNYKLKKITKEAEQDNDLDLYLKKKILLEKWRDDLSHPITELSFNNNTIDQICYSLWDLFVSDIIFFGANTFPENILIETDPRFHKEIAFNWNLIRDLDNNPHKVETDYGFEIEILDEKNLKKDIEKEINEFITNKVEKDKIEKAKDFYPDTKFLETPSYLRGISANFYAYKKQAEILLNFVANLYDRFENEILVIKFNEIKDKNVNVLRTILALEKEGFFTIKEIRNDKKEWIDKDNVYVKIQLVKSKIPVIKKFLSIAEKPEVKSKVDREPIQREREPIPIRGEIKIEGLKESLEALAKTKKEESKPRFPYQLPRGTKWENIIITFLDEENIFIQVKQFRHNTNYREMKLTGKGKNPKPSEIWNFLKLLAIKGGEILWENIKNLPRKDIDAIKKHKQSLSEFLQSYFTSDIDPFFPYEEYPPYKHEKSYKIRITLFPTQGMIKEAQSLKKKINSATQNDKNNNDLEIKEYLDEETPQVYDQYENKKYEEDQ